MTKRRIVSFARDEGSIQAIAPVIAALQKRGDVDARALAFDPDARPYVECGARVDKIDIGSFDADPVAFARHILQQWRPDVVLLGSSAPTGVAPNTPEQYVTVACHDARVCSVAVLDAWGYYDERFGLTAATARTCVPDVICALDRLCADELRQLGVPARNIVVTHNPWLDRIAIPGTLTSPRRHHESLRVLFVSQPLLENRGIRNWPYTQHELFRSVVGAVRRVRERRAVQLTVWLHPFENRETWSAVLDDARDIAPTLCEKRGPEAYPEVDVLVTSHSTLVYEALHVGVPCINLRPGDPPLARHLPDILGLTAKALNEEELATHLSGVDETMRGALREARMRLSKQGIFFSDGRATERVVATIYSALHQQAVG